MAQTVFLGAFLQRGIVFGVGEDLKVVGRDDREGRPAAGLEASQSPGAVGAHHVQEPVVAGGIDRAGLVDDQRESADLASATVADGRRTRTATERPNWV